MRSFPTLFLVMLGLYSLFYSCEKDDICLEETLPTPRLNISFVDAQNPELSKEVQGLQIKSLSIDSILPVSDPYLLPLRQDQSFTEFEFTTNLGTDTESKTLIQFTYQRKDEYINRACGFRGTYFLNEQSVAQSDPSNSWILGFEIRQDTVSNEETVHLALYH